MIKPFEKYYVISWIITLLIAVLIFYVSSLSFTTTPGPEFPLKSYFYHFVIFFIFSFFLFISVFKGNINGSNRLTIFFVFVFAVYYALLDEIHQLYVPLRTFSILDIMTDSVGIILAGVIYIILRKNQYPLLKSKTLPYD